ncbi:hypothetical protein [Lentzea sp. NPDC092896]|uniref:hypothetical protein n=1 Tax=Lentzea sp. NPDC092896 TaxID=3364127 RepID=UPI003828EC5F
MPDRYTDLSRRVHQRYAGTADDRHAFNNDPTFRASIEMIRKMVTATDAALAAEGVDEVIRDRVAHRVLFGEPPYAYPVPDFREALARLRTRDERLHELATLDLPRIQLDWLP